MNVDDVPLVMQPQWILDHLQFDVHPSIADSRLTFHNFSCSDFLVQHIVPHNSVAVQSNNDDWPPRFLFDVAYGCAALKTWGTREFVQFAEEQTKEFYYHNVDYDNDGDCDNDNVDNGPVRGAGKRASVHQVEKVGDTQAVDVLDMVMGLWMHNARKDMHQACMIQKEQTQESVQKWLQSVP